MGIDFNIISIQYKKILLTVLTVVFCVLPFNNEIFSQNINFQQFNTKNGLPSSQVYNMYQDSFGVIWFATDQGICNYNGYEFEYFGIKDGITSNTVFKFYPQEDGNIWCTTINNRIFYFNPKDRVFHPYQFNDELADVLGDLDCKSFFIDKYKTIHFSFRSVHGFLTIDSKGNIQNNLSENSNNYVASMVIETYQKNKSFTYMEQNPINRPLHIDVYKLKEPKIRSDYYQGMVKGNLKVISTNSDVYIINKQIVSKKISIGKQPITMGFIDESIFWIGYDFGGVKFYNLKGERVQSFLENESVTGVLIDHEGGYWVSTLYSGVFYVNNLKSNHFTLEENGNVHSLAVDGNGKLLVSILNGNVYHQASKGFDLWFKSTIKRPTLCQYYSSGSGNHFRDILFYSKDSYYSYSFKKMPEETGYPIYFPGYGYIFQANTPNEILPIPYKLRVFDVCATDKIIMLATRNGLSKYILKNKEVVRFKEQEINCTVSDIDLFKEETFLIATKGSGVGILDGDSLFMLTTDDGLTSNMVKEVYIQNDSIFWVCTNVGLNKVIAKDEGLYSVYSYTTFDGLADNNINDIEIIGDILWIASNSGLNTFSLTGIDQKYNADNCFLRVLNKKVNGMIVADLSNLTYDQNKLEFTYQAISFKGNNDLIYRYRLVGLDEKWNYTSNLNITYEALPYGEYVFELQVGMHDKWIGESEKANIIINPPYYKTFWFIISCILLGGLIIYLFFKYRVLSYNREIIRYLLIQILKRFRKGSLDFTVRENGVDVKINSLDVLYIKSTGNYLEIITSNNAKVVIRGSLNIVKKMVPDPIEYLQVHRSCVIRVDKISKKGAKSVFINDTEIQFGKTYRSLIPQIQLG